MNGDGLSTGERVYGTCSERSKTTSAGKRSDGARPPKSHRFMRPFSPPARGSAALSANGHDVAPLRKPIALSRQVNSYVLVVPGATL